MKLLYSEMNQVRLNKEMHITVAYGILWQVLYAAEILLSVEEKSRNEVIISGKNGSTEYMIDELLRGDCDVFIGEIPEQLNTKLMGIPLLNTHHSIFAFEDHPLLNGNFETESVSINDLSQYKWLILGSIKDLPGYTIPLKLRHKVEIQTIHDINSMFIIIRILQKSNALILLPYQVGEQLSLYNIKEIKNHDIHFSSYKSGIMLRKDKKDNPQLQLFINVIKDLM